MRPEGFGKWGKLAQFTAVAVLCICALGVISSIAFSLSSSVITEEPATTQERVDPLAAELAASSTVVHIGLNTVRAAVVDTEAAREQGLSGVQGLLPDEGMLFVFQKDSRYAFWMKDMLFSLDMVWLSQEKRVVYIAQNATPSSYPGHFVPPVPARYVLELPAGYVHAHSLQIGETVGF